MSVFPPRTEEDLVAEMVPGPAKELVQVEPKAELLIVADDAGIAVAAEWARACILNKLSVKVDELRRDDGVVLIEGLGW